MKLTENLVELNSRDLDMVHKAYVYSELCPQSFLKHWRAGLAENFTLEEYKQIAQLVTRNQYKIIED